MSNKKQIIITVLEPEANSVKANKDRQIIVNKFLGRVFETT